MNSFLRNTCLLLAGLLSGQAAANPATTPQESMNTSTKSLVVFFSRAGENYAVGHIGKGNTHIIADIIAEQTGADVFHIQPVTPYPSTYDACVEQAQQEKEQNARPAIIGDIDISDYDTIYLGYPNWWGDMPMPVYTFLEKHQWQGKTIYPFCTHEGSGLSRTPANIARACPGATVREGLAIRGSVAQRQHEAARKAVQAWLTKQRK